MGSESFFHPTECEVRLAHGIQLITRSNTPASGRPRVLFLHGFPEAAFVWDPLLHALDGQVHALAPNLRGYAGSSSPQDVQAYRAQHLVADVAGLIEHFGAPVDLLVAHDWGGAVAWALAAQRPELLQRLLIINAPHPATFLRELLQNPVQQAASAYMNFLCRPDAATLLAEDDFRRLWPFFERMGATQPSQAEGPWLTDALRQRYREVWRQGLDGALNYYRASPLRPADGTDAPLHRVQWRRESVTVCVPTRVLWGLGDTALAPGLLDGLQDYVPDLQVQTVPDATHWLVHEQPQLVLQVVRELLGLA